jgi:hypothetical protein
MFRCHIAHRHGASDCGTKSPGSHGADLATVGAKHHRALARRRAALGADADPHAPGTFGKLAQDARGAWEIPLFAAALGDGPGEPGLDGAGIFVDIVAVEAETGLEPEGITRPEAGGRHLFLIEKPPRQIHGFGVGDENLEPVLAGIARPRHKAIRRTDGYRPDIEKPHFRHAGRQPGENLGRRRPLQGEERAVLQRLHCHVTTDPGRDMIDVHGLAGGVQNQDQGVFKARHHDVVENAATLVRDHGVAHAPGS